MSAATDSQSRLTEREPLFGFPYVVGDLAGVSADLAGRAARGEGPYLVAHSDVHVLTHMLRDAEYGEGLRRFDAICPDGMPLVWLLRRKGAPAERLYGPDMMEWMWRRSPEYGLKHFLLGGSEDAVRLLQENLHARYPGTEVVGQYCPPMPPWPEGEDERILERLRASGANCVWVALGCPRQERWLYRHRDVLPPAVYFGVGAAFNFHAGLVRQAPLWVRQHGMEWLYRLCCEPRRLLKRYLVHNSLFLWYLMTRKV